MVDKQNNAKMQIWAYGVIAILVVIVFVLLFANSQNKSPTPQTITVNLSGSNSSQNLAALQANYSAEVARFNNLQQNYTSLLGKYEATSSNQQKIIQVLYSDKTVYITAPVHNYNYSYLNGCYWIDGYYNFSFNAPYAGYVIFNETNTGKPNNKTFGWFGMYISTQKPVYAIISPYNLTGCTGESMWYIETPVTGIAPAKNQTMIIPVTNGTNYVIFYNGNAYLPWGLDNPINVTFSMKYVGLKSYNINNPYPSYASIQANQIAPSTLPTGTALTLLSKFVAGSNVLNSSINGFEVNFVRIGTPNPLGVSPAIIKVYYNNTFINSTEIFPQKYATFNKAGHILSIYVNQTSQQYALPQWATIQLFN